jgi:ATP-dependent DNA helicase RecG
LTLYGDLDKSILDEMPPGRIPIKTVWIKKLDNLWINAIRSEVSKGNQAYWVFPLVEESEKIDLKAATEGSQQIALMFPDMKVGLLHGKMKQREKDAIMAEFRARDIDILVATTVIEVGVDVPDATMMIIEHAERFGLSQLHQLRGRIGRRDKASTCLLISSTRTDTSMRRLGAMVETTDGFKLAEVDLELRGPGDYFGSKQSGLPTMLVANLLKDERILLEAKKIAEIVAQGKSNPIYAGVFERLQEQPHLYVGNEGMN